MTYTEDLSPEAAKAIVGDKYDSTCRYQLAQDRHEAAVWKWIPGEEEPEAIPLEDTNPVGYDTFLIDQFLPERKGATYDPIYLEDELHNMDRRYTMSKWIAITVCITVVVFCCLFVLGVHYGILKI